MKLRSTIMCLLASVLFLFTVVPAQADLFGFYNITNNKVADAEVGEAQLWVDVTNPEFPINHTDPNQVLFTFGNTGAASSSICDVYYDDGALLGIASITSSAGVLFSQIATPGELPGANQASPIFETTEGFSADSDAPPQPNGVNPGETLGILFDLQGGFNFNHVIAQLESGALRIGLHVQGFESTPEGGSESFVNNEEGGWPTHGVPEPATMLLLGSGLIVIGVSGKKRFKK